MLWSGQISADIPQHNGQGKIIPPIHVLGSSLTLMSQQEGGEKSISTQVVLSQGNPQYQYRLGDELIAKSPAEMDLGIPVDEECGYPSAMCTYNPES